MNTTSYTSNRRLCNLLTVLLFVSVIVNVMSVVTAVRNCVRVADTNKRIALLTIEHDNETLQSVLRNSSEITRLVRRGGAISHFAYTLLLVSALWCMRRSSSMQFNMPRADGFLVGSSLYIVVGILIIAYLIGYYCGDLPGSLISHVIDAWEPLIVSNQTCFNIGKSIAIKGGLYIARVSVLSAIAGIVVTMVIATARLRMRIVPGA